LFTIDHTARYEGAMTVKMQIVGDPMRTGFVEARVRSTRTIPEDYSLNQREGVLYDMVDTMTHSLDVRLEEEIRAKLPVFLI
jgi:hypothetical protein